MDTLDNAYISNLFERISLKGIFNKKEIKFEKLRIIERNNFLYISNAQNNTMKIDTSSKKIIKNDMLIENSVYAVAFVTHYTVLRQLDLFANVQTLGKYFINTCDEVVIMTNSETSRCEIHDVS